MQFRHAVHTPFVPLAKNRQGSGEWGKDGLSIEVKQSRTVTSKNLIRQRSGNTSFSMVFVAEMNRLGEYYPFKVAKSLLGRLCL